jgi:hypothetical protein
MTRAYNTATTQQNSGGAVTPITAGKNAIINGGMDIWQRGTTFSPSAGAGNLFMPDRWIYYKGGGTYTVSRQSSGLTGIQYCARVQRTAASTDTNIIYSSYNFESADSYRFAGQTITFSFYARKGADYSASGSTLAVYMSYGTGTDQNITTTGQTSLATNSATLTTSWQRFTTSVAVPSTATQLFIQTSFTPVGTASTNDYYEITGIQVEAGSVATPFSRAGGTIQGELSAAQRYYTRESVTNGYSYLRGFGNATTTSLARIIVPFPVEMRVKPTAMDFGGALAVSDGGTFYSTGSFVLSTNSTTENAQVEYTHGTASFIQYRYYGLQDAAAATAYIGFSAEL